jgi:hypothetical protein
MLSGVVHVISHPHRKGFPVEPRVVAEAAASTATALEIKLWELRCALEAARPGDDVLKATRRLARPGAGPLRTGGL